MSESRARVGDFIRVDVDVPGLHPRLGQVLEVFGDGGGERYRIRWDDDSESALFPSRPVEIVASVVGRGDSEADGLPDISAPEPVRIKTTATLQQIAESMKAAHLAAVLVHELDRVTGVITQLDIAQLLATGTCPDDLAARDILDVLAAARSRETPQTEDPCAIRSKTAMRSERGG